MLFHLWPNRLTGGYVGVDVFFAISGFLITAHLLAEIDTTGRLQPARFWARRAKRLVPASTTVLFLTALGVVIWVPRALWRQFLTEIIASTVQAQNWLLARDSVDYLAANNTASPTQHFWTLSVEEQFYIALPLLLLLAIGLARLFRVGHRPVIGTGLVLIVAGSLGYSVWLTAANPGVAYFSTLTRAWEFGAGSLLAFSATAKRPSRSSFTVRVPSTLRPALTWMGMAGIVASCVLFGSKTPFPGFAAALPVLGAVLVIWSGSGSGAGSTSGLTSGSTASASTFDRFGQLPPVALLGRISYAAYLWHWPLIVLLPHVTNRPLATLDKVGIIAATVVLSWLSTTVIEDPIRFRPRLLGQRRPLTVAVWSAAAMAVVISFSTVTLRQQDVRDEQQAKVAQKVVAEKPSCLGAQAMDPTLMPCVNPALDGMLVPDPAQAKRDQKYRPDCLGVTAAGLPRVCTFGPTTGYTKRIFAGGDSHNNVLIEVYRRIAENNHWRIDVASHNGCYLSTARNKPASDSSEPECEAWRAGAMNLARKGGYDAIFVTHAQPVIPRKGETIRAATLRGLVGAWRQLPNVPIVAIRDNPWARGDVVACVAEHRTTAARACAVSRSEGLVMFDGQAEAALKVPRARVVDVTSLYCTAKVCPPVIGHVLVYKDHTHITAAFAATISPYIERHVLAALTP